MAEDGGSGEEATLSPIFIVPTCWQGEGGPWERTWTIFHCNFPTSVEQWRIDQKISVSLQSTKIGTLRCWRLPNDLFLAILTTSKPIGIPSNPGKQHPNSAKKI
uniref:Uncharacterized protein n=1 Tax=Aegilops tauschii subsp. strangulata TaxID=200361 RepID=A0A453PW08_AEGTS